MINVGNKSIMSTDAPPSYTEYPRDRSNLSLPELREVREQEQEEEEVPLPEGWVREWDPQYSQHFYVDTTQTPAKSSWLHPYEDTEWLAANIPDTDDAPAVPPKPSEEHYSPPPTPLHRTRSFEEVATASVYRPPPPPRGAPPRDALSNFLASPSKRTLRKLRRGTKRGILEALSGLLFGAKKQLRVEERRGRLFFEQMHEKYLEHRERMQQSRGSRAQTSHGPRSYTAYTRGRGCCSGRRVAVSWKQQYGKRAWQRRIENLHLDNGEGSSTSYGRGRRYAWKN